jgi:hypothetical protein
MCGANMIVPIKLGGIMVKYYLSDSTRAIGPYSPEQLAGMSIRGDTSVLAEGEESWQRAEEVAELQPAIIEQAEAMMASASESIAAKGGMFWAPVKDDGYIKPGHRKYSAQLMNIPDGQSWEDACAVMPNTINGHYFPRPTRCINNWGMWGEWDVPDPAFADTFNVLVFLYPSIPLELGHVGWGFRLDDGRWCWGATELSGGFVAPGQPNGACVERGTREQMMSWFRDGLRPNSAPWKYFSYKALRADHPRGSVGEQMAEATKQMGYSVVGNNCMTHALSILNGYAGYPILPLPVIHPVQMIPRVWFTLINATEYHVYQHFWEVRGEAVA